MGGFSGWGSKEDVTETAAASSETAADEPAPSGALEMMSISVEPKVTTDRKFQLEIRWSATDTCTYFKALSPCDTLCIVPTVSAGEWSERASLVIGGSVNSSGRAKGLVLMEITGLVSPDTEYEIHYIVYERDELDVGQSAPFSFTSEQVPQFASETELEAARLAAMQFNGSSSMQHYITLYKSKASEVDWNPLLSIEPEVSVLRVSMRWTRGVARRFGLALSEVPHGLAWVVIANSFVCIVIQVGLSSRQSGSFGINGGSRWLGWQSIEELLANAGYVMFDRGVWAGWELEEAFE